MGTYTQFAFHADLKPETPQGIKTFFELMGYPMLDADLALEQLDSTNHPFFLTERWTHVLRTGDHPYNVARTNRLCVRAELKNYDNEIQKFLDWIMPWVDPGNQWVLGFYMSEVDDEPTYVFRDADEAHTVKVFADNFAIEHPLAERMDGSLSACKLHEYISGFDGPPVDPGTYRVHWKNDDWKWAIR